MDVLSGAVLVVLAAAVGEGVSEFFFTPFFDLLKGKVSETLRVQMVRLWSGAVGVVIALELGLDVFGLVGATMIHPVAGQIATGLLVGRGSNYVHEFINSFIINNKLKAQGLG
jgi:hypothetical protein